MIPFSLLKLASFIPGGKILSSKWLWMGVAAAGLIIAGIWFRGVLADRSELTSQVESLQAAQVEMMRQHNANTAALEQSIRDAEKRFKDTQRLREVIRDEEDGPIAPVLRTLLDELRHNASGRREQNTD